MELRSPFLLLLVFVVPGAISACTSDPCGNQPDCTGCSSGDMVPDPEDCHGYYLCIGNGSGDYLAEPGDCPEGEVFDLTVLACVEGTECTRCPSVCAHECSLGYSYIPSFDDCNMYYRCSDGSPVGPLHCDSATPYFDGEECQTEEALCCRCQPDCSETDDPHLVSDPLDCRKYWICVSASPPTMYGMCDDGEAFDPVTEACSSAALCTTVCPNVVGLDGCIDPFICYSEGNYAKCPDQCVTEYYDCAGETYPYYQDPVECEDGKMFYDGHCIYAFNCP